MGTLYKDMIISMLENIEDESMLLQLYEEAKRLRQYSGILKQYDNAKAE